MSRIRVIGQQTKVVILFLLKILPDLLNFFQRGDKKLTIDEKYEMDIELFSGPSPFSIFRLCNAYFDWYPIIEDPTSGILEELRLSAFHLTFNGGIISEYLSDEVTHVVFSTLYVF